MGNKVIDSVQLPSGEGKIFLTLTATGYSPGRQTVENCDLPSKNVELIHECCAPVKMNLVHIPHSKWVAFCPICGLRISIFSHMDSLIWRVLKYEINHQTISL